MPMPLLTSVLPATDRSSRGLEAGADRGVRGNWVVWGLVFLVSAAAGPGCSGLRARLAHRSAECNQLCEESRLAREAGQDIHADKLLDAAIRQRPTDTQTRLDLAEELWSSGRQIAAADVVARMVAERPDDAPAALRLARMEFEIGRTAAAEAALRLAMINDPENPEAVRLKAELAERRGDWDGALATYQQLMQLVPDDLNASLAMASVHVRRGQSDRAAPILRAVVHHPQATAQQRRAAEWQLGMSYAQADRWSDAVASLESAMHYGNATAEDWYRVAYAQARVGDQAAAYASISRALQLSPNHGGALELARSIRLGDDAPLTAVVPAGFTRQAALATGDEDQRARL